MKKKFTLIFLIFLFALSVFSEEFEDEAINTQESSTLNKIKWYFPNRILDSLDLIRLRIKMGPGVGGGIRLTKWLEIYGGVYKVIYVGFPGSRLGKHFRMPVGLESYNGFKIRGLNFELSSGTANYLKQPWHWEKLEIIDQVMTGKVGPSYSSTSISVNLQLIIIGFDVGVNPEEFLDFIGGFVFWDPMKDDL